MQEIHDIPEGSIVRLIKDVVDEDDVVIARSGAVFAWSGEDCQLINGKTMYVEEGWVENVSVHSQTEYAIQVWTTSPSGKPILRWQAKLPYQGYDICLSCGHSNGPNGEDRQGFDCVHCGCS